MILPTEVNILGITYKVFEEQVVNKSEPRWGEIDFNKQIIKIDSTLQEDKKTQVFLHEIIHGIFDELGFYEQSEDEKLVQSLATALHQSLKKYIIFS